jgi:hypothetical protein
MVLARVLHINNINAVVYEVESSRSARSQGGMLDLHFAGGSSATYVVLVGADGGLTWPSMPGTTLIGDAAPLMPPVGQGANMAMLEGALLALALAAHPNDSPPPSKNTISRCSSAPAP